MSDGRRKHSEVFLLRGSLVRLRRKCGKPRCRCTRGELHETWALSYSVRGRTRMVPLRPQDLPEVRRALTRYKKALETLERNVLQGIERLRETIRQRKHQGGRT